MLALDQRGSFRKMMSPNNPDDVDEQEAIKIKKDIVMAGYDIFSGVLIDQDFGLPAYQACPTCEKPFLLPAEESGYEEVSGEKITKIKYSAEDIKDMGAQGVKLLIYFDPNAESAMRQIQTAKKVLEDAHSQKLPLFLEIVTYGESKSVVNSVSMFLKNNVRPNIFKLEYPGSAEKCKQITDILGTTPWIILTAGIDFDTFCENLKTAVQNGCSGFLAGRSLWKEYVSMTGEEAKNQFLHEIFIPRFNKIVSIAKENHL